MDYLYKIYKDKADPRVSDWLLVQSPWPMLILTAIYLYIVWKGPKWMATRRAYDLKPLLVVYNLALVVLSVYMFWEFFASSVLNPEFSLMCEPVDYSTKPQALRLASVIWWYYISKIIEFMDTFFFILRKKNNQISFLHVYHHSTMVVLWYIGTRYLAGGESYFSAMINSFIHILMYTYYGLSACGPALQKYLWWKKYMTSLQLLQFVVVVVQTSVALSANCGFPPEWLMFLIFYLISHILLFSNFFHQTYNVRKDREHTTKKPLPLETGTKSTQEKAERRNGYQGYVPYDLLYKERNIKKIN